MEQSALVAPQLVATVPALLAAEAKAKPADVKSERPAK
jgi:hypothetical protein